MRVSRQNNELNDAIETIDQRFIEAQRESSTKESGVSALAWSKVTPDEQLFIDDEIDKCIASRRYFMENYYIIRDERGRLKSLHEFWDHQVLLYDTIEDEWAKKGCCRLIVLKPRQAGSTTWNAALIFHETIFVPNSYSLMMAQDGDVSAEIYQRVTDAYHNLPWWMMPENMSKQQGKQIIFQRDDEASRSVDPGLGSTLMIAHAQRTSGVAIGRTVRNLLGSEVSRWPDPTVWTADIKPSLNAPDMLGILESIAYGRSGLYYNMWRAAESGKSIWRALFIPVYKVRKYFIPVLKSEQFTLTPEEKGLRNNVKLQENFTIPLGFFKWRRAEIIETINSTGSDETHYESYPVTANEAFISSGFCAFPRKELTRQERVNCIPPVAIGEIEYRGVDLDPILHLHPPAPDEILEPAERFNRLWVWEYPEKGSETEYYLSSDVGGGQEGNDYSDIQVYRLGYANEPDYQCCEWHGHMNPSHLARVIAALGQWYNSCEVAVEYAQSGITACNELQWNLDYENIYRWKHLDKIGGTQTQHMHWMTTERTRSDAINRANERLLDHTTVIRNKFLIEEMRDFGTEDGSGKAAGLSANDDSVLTFLINVGASSQSGKREAMADSMAQGTGVNSSIAAGVMPNVPTRYSVYDHYSRHVCDMNTKTEAEQFIVDTGKLHGIDLRKLWRVVPVIVSKANTPYSPAYDGQGAAHDLYTEHGVSPRDTMVSPGIMEVYKSILNAKHRMGQDMQDISGDDEF